MTSTITTANYPDVYLLIYHLRCEVMRDKSGCCWQRRLSLSCRNMAGVICCFRWIHYRPNHRRWPGKTRRPHCTVSDGKFVYEFIC